VETFSGVTPGYARFPRTAVLAIVRVALFIIKLITLINPELKQ